MLYPILLFIYLVKNFEKIKNKDLSPKFSILYEHLNTENIENLLAPIIDILRRLLYGVNMILFYSSPYIQVVINSVSSFVVFHYYFVYRPCSKKFDNIMNLYTEINNFLTLSFIGAFISEDLPNNMNYVAEWSVIILIYLSIMGPTMINLILSIRDLTLWIRARNRRGDAIRG
jgi:hypothetical protein